VQRLVISRMQARQYQERLAAAAEIAKGAVAATNGASANGASSEGERAAAAA
jgi:hypothetical protein